MAQRRRPPGRPADPAADPSTQGTDPEERPASEQAGPDDGGPIRIDTSSPFSTPMPIGDRMDKDTSERRGLLAFLRELPGLILIAFLLALLIKSFVIQAFFIPSKSMTPTLLVGDRVIVNKFIYDFRDPRHGEVIVFENPHLDEPDRNPLAAFWNWLTEGLGFSADPNKDFIKRVIGVPGDVIEVRNGAVFRNGEKLEEPYVSRQKDSSDFGPEKVEPEHVFVMGDNRPNSQDSRNIGPIPYDKIVGEAFLIIWKPARIQWLSDD